MRKLSCANEPHFEAVDETGPILRGQIAARCDVTKTCLPLGQDNLQMTRIKKLAQSHSSTRVVHKRPLFDAEVSKSLKKSGNTRAADGFVAALRKSSPILPNLASFTAASTPHEKLPEALWGAVHTWPQGTDGRIASAVQFCEASRDSEKTWGPGGQPPGLSSAFDAVPQLNPGLKLPAVALLHCVSSHGGQARALRALALHFRICAPLPQPERRSRFCRQGTAQRSVRAYNAWHFRAPLRSPLSDPAA